jgi:hypothetical protein
MNFLAAKTAQQKSSLTSRTQPETVAHSMTPEDFVMATIIICAIAIIVIIITEDNNWPTP